MKVFALSVAASISRLNFAVTRASRATFIAPLAGTLALTTGGTAAGPHAAKARRRRTAGVARRFGWVVMVRATEQVSRRPHRALNAATWEERGASGAGGLHHCEVPPIHFDGA